MILLYSADETQFDTNGIGSLADAVSCVVTEERNSTYELEMVYPVTGQHYADIQYRTLIFVKPNPFDQPQPFRVYRISRPLNGLVTVYAWHISYDLNGIPVKPFHTYTIDATLSALTTNAAITNIFTYSTDKPDSMAGEVWTDAPYSARNILGGIEGSVLQTYRGEFKFDRFNVALLTNRGQNNGVTLRYGKNLIGLTQDEDFSELYTGVAPFWKGEDTSVYLPETIVFAQGSFGFERILSLDLSGEFDAEPTLDQLRTRAAQYISDNAISTPKDSLDIDYAMDATIGSVRLCDTVSCLYMALGVQATAKVVKTVYDALLERYKSITLGSIRSNFADSYAQQTQNLTRRIRNIESDYTSTGEAREIVTEEITTGTAFVQRAESIIATALDEYVRTGDFETFRSSVITQLSVQAGEIEANFESTSTSISTLSGQTEQQFASIRSFIRLLATQTDEHGTITQQGGIVIGESSSDIKLKLENDILYFFTGDEKLVTTANAIAWFASNQLYVNNTTIQNLTLGTTGAYLDARIVGSGDNRCVLWSGRLA